jgi:hypothetical protein
MRLTDNFKSLKSFKFFPIVEKDINNNPIPEKQRSVLGIVEGVFFVPNGKSRNGRWYSREFWEVVLKKPEIQAKLKDLMMYGAIGHQDLPVTDQDLNDGKVSHIVVDLWIDENGNGMGRLLILNTDAGRNLITYMSVEYEGRRSKLRISSRAAGEYKEGVNYEGLPVVDENTFTLDTFDVVKEPGFIETNLNLATKNNESVKENLLEKDRGSKMELTESDIKAIKKLAESGESAVLENLTLKNEIKVLTEKVANSDKLTKIVQSLDSDSLKVIESLIKENNTGFIKEWHSIGTPSEINESLDKTEAQSDVLESYIALGTTDNINKLVIESQKQSADLKAYQAVGTIDEVKDVVESLKVMAPKLEVLGNLDEAIQALEVSKKVLPVITKKLESEVKKNLDNKAVEIAKKYNQDLESVKKNLVKLGESETHKLYLQFDKKPNQPQNSTNESKSKPIAVGTSVKSILERLNQKPVTNNNKGVV